MNLESRISNLESDAVARRRAVEETANSFVVEASAGTARRAHFLTGSFTLCWKRGRTDLRCRFPAFAQLPSPKKPPVR